MDTYDPPELEGWLEAMIAREEAEPEAAIEEVKKELGLDGEA